MNRPRLNKTEEKALSEFRERLLREFASRIVLIKLYGSRARGERHWYSDVDVLVVVKRLTKKFKGKVLDIECEIDEKYGYKSHISSTEMSLAEYKWMLRRDWPFIVNVEEDGIELWRHPEIEINP
ncbi:MAG: nucleotidyltransferase domain-containing protein [bacterium]